jgi:hypothetical protein
MTPDPQKEETRDGTTYRQSGVDRPRRHEGTAGARGRYASPTSGSPEPVTDQVWEEAARHFDDQQLGAIVLAIDSINAWNRLNVTTRQVTGEWINQWIPSAERAVKAV